MSDESMWEAVLARDKRADGRFLYAVQSTGVYCRPSCPSRRPRRDQVSFFGSATDAEAAGFRACRRCHPDADTVPERHLSLVEQMCRYLEEQEDCEPTLQELGDTFHLSPAHLSRVFQRVTGVTPKQYAAARRIERLKRRLRTDNGVTGAVYEAGFQSASSAYEQATQNLGMSPGAYRQGGTADEIRYVVVPCPLGFLLVAATPRGICAVRLGDSEAELEASLTGEFPRATTRRDDGGLRDWVGAILEHLRGEQPHLELPLDIRATAFQRRVWAALRAIPYGATQSYADIARAIGQPTATRAVGQAVGANPVAVVIPCHRAIRADGSIGGYRWGVERKRALLEQEAERACGKDRLPNARKR